MSAFGVGKEMAAWVLNVYIFRFGYLIYHFHFYFGELGGEIIYINTLKTKVATYINC